MSKKEQKIKECCVECGEQFRYENEKTGHTQGRCFPCYIRFLLVQIMKTKQIILILTGKNIKKV